MINNNEKTISTSNGEDLPVATLCEPEFGYIVPRIAKFEKVSYEQFKADMLDRLGDVLGNNEPLIQQIYNDIKCPTRATKDSAGYDFYAPFSFKPTPGCGIVIPTGIRCRINTGWVLKLYPRSGQGFKYGIHLYNTTGIIDADYFYADNEGHIMIKVGTKEESEIINKGTAFCQGVFVPYGITEDDDVDTVRTGGLGSTTENK